MKLIFTCFTLLLLQFCASAQKATPDFRQRVTMLKRFMDKNHYQPRQWNDSTSALLFDHWLNELDDDKIYFTKKDITLLEQYKTKTSLIGGADFFTASINLYRTRVHEADSSINTYLAKTIDFTKPDLFHWPASDYAADKKEQDARLRHYLKWQIIDNITDKLDPDESALSSVTPVEFAKLETEERGRIRKRETNLFSLLLQSPADFRKDMEDEFLDAMAWCYDPHSNYMNLRAKQTFEAAVSAEEFTAGFTLEENDKGDRTVDFLQPGSSAWKSGQLHKGDVLLKVKNDKKEYDVTDLSSGELQQVLGSVGSLEVTIKTVAGEIKTVKLEQEKVTDEDNVVKSYLVKGDKTIGYIDLPGFYSREEEDEKEMNYKGCANDVSKELIKLKKDNIAGLIIDLRNNGGGNMWEAIQLAGIFIDAGPVASVKDKDGKVIMMKDPNRGTMYDGPMVILINGRSASASEFFAAAMQDYNRAVIMGGTTYGKGTAQGVMPMDTLKGTVNDYTEFVKVTGAKFYRVNGSTVQWKGVESDVPLPDIYSAGDHREKTNASALLPDMSKQGYYQPLPALPISMLREKSAARVNADPYYKFLSGFLINISAVETGIDVPLDIKGFDAFHKKYYSSLSASQKDLFKKDLSKADNNSFDKERISLSSVQAKNANEAYLKQISQSSDIAEACKVLEDLIGGK